MRTKDVMFITKLKLLSIGTINLLEETIPLYAISITIKTTKYVVTNVTIKSIYIHPAIRQLPNIQPIIFLDEPIVALEDNVYPQSYQHHKTRHVFIDETPTKEVKVWLGTKKDCLLLYLHLKHVVI